MSRPLVSTITPCYRMGRYLKGFLDSLPEQTYFENLEVVLDHNEPDESEVGWVQSFQNAHPGRLRHIVADKVDPIGVSMNRCIRESTGELTTIWNVDDLRTPDSIESQVRALVAGEGSDIAYGDYITVSSFGATSGIPVYHRHVPATEFTRSMIFGPFFMFRKALCDRAGIFDEQLRSGADFDLSVRLALHGTAVMVDRSLGFYLNEGRGASTRPNSLQPVERTVIELRYGIYDKIDYSYLPPAVEYNIPNLLISGAFAHVRHFVPRYAELMQERRGAWLLAGIGRYYYGHRQSNSFSQKVCSGVRRILGRS